MNMGEGTKKLTMTTARQHYIDAAVMTKAELAKFNKDFFNGAWITSVKKRTMVKGYREKLATWITANGGSVPEV